MLSRWQPRLVFCTEHADFRDRPGVRHVVKFARGPAGTAALISEVVAGHLLQAGGLAVLERRLVEVGPIFASSFNSKPDRPYEIEPGLHFGTVFLPDVVDGPPPNHDTLADPRELVDLWVFDSWLCTTDRTVRGNVLLRAQGQKAYLIAADHSDCFGGAGRFADGTWRSVLDNDKAAESTPFLPTAIFQTGADKALAAAIQKVHQALGQMDAAIADVPAVWWQQATIDPREVRDRLERRAGRLNDILKIQQWRGIGDDTQGAHVF
jgi:hypothetical protein